MNTLTTPLVLVALALCAQLVVPAVARAESPVVVAPQQDLRSIVRGQLDAFDRGDAEAAWAPVSPGLRERFGSAEGFLQMVRVGYGPLVGSREVRFGEQVLLPTGEMGQWLDVTGADGRRVRALYMFDEIDGRWQTTGCLLFDREPATTAV